MPTWALNLTASSKSSASLLSSPMRPLDVSMLSCDSVLMATLFALACSTVDLPLAEALWLDAIVELVLGVELVLLDRRGVGQVGDAGADLVGLGAQ
jgi:hypothetical protein